MSRSERGAPTSGSLLLICTANRARSVIASFVFQNAIAAAGLEAPVVRSAGTRARPGEPPMADAVALLAERGWNAESFRSSVLTPAAIDEADLVLCAERSHRSDVVRLVPRAHRKTLTLLQAARLVPHIRPPEGPPDSGLSPLARLTEELMAARGHGPASGDDDISDPAGHSRVAYDEAAALIDIAAASLTGALAGVVEIPTRDSLRRGRGGR